VDDLLRKPHRFNNNKRKDDTLSYLTGLMILALEAVPKKAILRKR